MTKLVLFGHSHLGSITRAYDERKTKSDAPFDLEVVQFIRDDIPHIIHGENGWQYNPDGARQLQEVLETIKPRAVFCSLQGEQAVWAGLVAPERPFDFFFPGENRMMAIIATKWFRLIWLWRFAKITTVWLQNSLRGSGRC